ncbi:MAG: DUF3105 domain-containing protein [Solirubrobacterales bacterium]
MASRKEEKERLRQQRLAAERRETQAGRSRLFAGYAIAGLLAAAVVVGIIVVIASGNDDGGGAGGGDTPENAHIDPTSGVVAADPDGREGSAPPAVEQARLEQAAEAANCDLQLDLPDEGNDHFENEDEGSYDTSPPTSGDHYGSNTEAGAGALADGAYSNTPPLSRAVHALEHGRIEIQYSPDLPEEDQLALKGVLDEDPAGMIMFPNSDMPYEVAATAWTNMLGCETYEGPATLDAIRAFRDTYRGQGPEPVPI